MLDYYMGRRPAHRLIGEPHRLDNPRTDPGLSGHRRGTAARRTQSWLPARTARRRRKGASAPWFGKRPRRAASNAAVLPVKQSEIRLDSREFARMFTRAW